VTRAPVAEGQAHYSYLATGTSDKLRRLRKLLVQASNKGQQSQIRNDALEAQNIRLSQLLEQAGLDSARRDTALRVQQVLTEELHHRMTNMLTLVTAIVRQSLKSAESLPEAARAIEARLMAMARAHDVLLKADLDTAGLTGVVLGAIEQHGSALGRIKVQGDELVIVSSAIVPITLMLNELCTNATKYGALSKKGGTVSLSWTKAGDTIAFRWIEAGGPAVVASGRRSFGSKLIEALPRQLGGRGKLSFPATGVEFEFVVPAKNFEASSVTIPWNQSAG
jgi:two-component sensor histidine kinase